jgi:hypothetical protein
MSTVTLPSTNGSRKSGSASLTLTVNGQPYDLTIRRAEAPDVGRVFRLEKSNGDSYDVSEHADECLCTCPDFECRRRGLDALGCKHIRALRGLGLMLEAPAFAQDAQEAAGAIASPIADDWTLEVRPDAPVPYQPTASDWAEFGEWSASLDGEIWEPGPEPTYDLAGYVDAQADRYRRLGTLAGDLVATHLATLASAVRLAQTNSPGVAMDRIASLERGE